MSLLWLCNAIETLQSSETFSGIHPKDKNDIINKDQDRKMASGQFGIKVRSLAEVIEKEELFLAWIPYRKRFNKGF